MKYFCVLYNEDCTNIIKFYCSEYLDKLYFNLSKPTKFINIYKIKKTNNYKLNNIKYDKIISIFAKDEKYIELIENLYKVELKYLRKIGEFILKNNFINYRAIDLLNIILMYEFNKLGLEVTKINEKKIIEINNKNEKKFINNVKKNMDKYELLLIKNLSKSIN